MAEAVNWSPPCLSMIAAVVATDRHRIIVSHQGGVERIGVAESMIASAPELAT
jgi:hypothetical protein